MRDTIIGLHHHDCAEQDGDERGLDREMRRQPRIACAMNWAPFVQPDTRQSMPGSGISSSAQNEAIWSDQFKQATNTRST